MFPVTIAELNKPLSYALRKEDLQISALAHNTLIENNIKTGDIVNVLLMMNLSKRSVS